MLVSTFSFVLGDYFYALISLFKKFVKGIENIWNFSSFFPVCTCITNSNITVGWANCKVVLNYVNFYMVLVLLLFGIVQIRIHRRPLLIRIRTLWVSGGELRWKYEISSLKYTQDMIIVQKSTTCVQDYVHCPKNNLNFA